MPKFILRGHIYHFVFFLPKKQFNITRQKIYSGGSYRYLAQHNETLNFWDNLGQKTSPPMTMMMMVMTRQSWEEEVTTDDDDDETILGERSHRRCCHDPHVASPLQHRSSMFESRPDVASSVNPLLPPFTGSPQIKMAGTVLSPVTDFNVFLIIAPSTPSLFTSRDLNWVPMDWKVSLAMSQ